jgi:hypothetical protein
VPIESNAGPLAGDMKAAAELLRTGIGVEHDMAAVMLAAVHAPRHTGAYAGSIRATGEPGKVSLSTAADYANIVEFGSRWVRGSRVLWKAVQASEPAWTQIADDGIQTTLDQIRG